MEDTSRKEKMSTGMPEEGREAERMNHMKLVLTWQRMGSLAHLTELNVLEPIFTSTAVPFHTTWSSVLPSRSLCVVCRGKGE